MHPVTLPPFPPQIARLPKNDRGYPVPFFVGYHDGKPDFRLARPEALRDCREKKLCWICGGKMGDLSTFVVGPMCCVNRNSAEPPSHLSCATFSVQACPFMLRPAMERREDDFTRTMGRDPAGLMIKRNPGVIALWTTRRYFVHTDGRGGVLYNTGAPESISIWREGRAATKAETLESMHSGKPFLEEACGGDEEQLSDLNRLFTDTLDLLNSLVFKNATA